VQRSSLLIVATTIILAAGLFYVIVAHPPSGTHATTSIGNGNCTSYSNSFVVVADESGFNNSIAHGAPAKPWPILCAQEGEQIKITVVNDDTVEPHGFAVSDYLEAGITVLPQHSQVITFVADRAGDFKIYCNVICAIHPYMQSGVLVVA
jgi:nitrous oxide reductase